MTSWARLSRMSMPVTSIRPLSCWRTAIKQEPQRSDLRLKLMEVYAQQGDRDGFVGQERQLVATGDNHAQVEQLKSRFPAMALAAAGGISAAAAGSRA